MSDTYVHGLTKRLASTRITGLHNRSALLRYGSQGHSHIRGKGKVQISTSRMLSVRHTSESAHGRLLRSSKSIDTFICSCRPDQKTQTAMVSLPMHDMQVTDKLSYRLDPSQGTLHGVHEYIVPVLVVHAR